MGRRPTAARGSFWSTVATRTKGTVKAGTKAEQGRATAREMPAGNRARIIEASLELFNDHGVHAISTNHIAAHLGISPGNLYYHFANREEIVRAIFPQAAEAVRAALPVSRGMQLAAADVGRFHLTGIEALWRFRFYFRDPDELVSRDPVLAESFRELQRWLTGQFELLFEVLIEQGRMHRPDPPEDLRRIAVNAFILWTNWIRYVTNARGELDIRRADIAEGGLHGFLVLAPYMEPGFAAEVRATFDPRAHPKALRPGSRAAAPAS